MFNQSDLIGDTQMEQFSKKILVASIVLAFGMAGNAMANPTNTAVEVVNDQTATASSV